MKVNTGNNSSFYYTTYVEGDKLLTDPGDKLFDILEKAYECPFSILDKEDAFNKIIEAYKIYRNGPEKIKVIFLDVDGVLNSYLDRMSYDLCTDSHFEILKKIVDATDAKIVLSSSWRIIRKMSAIVERRLKDFGMEIYSRTPQLDFIERTCRGDEIRAWLEKYDKKF